MKRSALVVLLLALSLSQSLAQLRDYRTHLRSMLRETVFNTGELGRGYDKGQTGMTAGQSALEWPPNSAIILDRVSYFGQHNSFGGGFWIAGTDASGTRAYAYCGAVSANTGRATAVEGVYSTPLSITRTENFPVLADGRVNPGYNPNEAEEKIVAQWSTIGLPITVTRTSRSWSTPGYDSFIILEYAIQNTSPTDTLKDVFVAFPEAYAPSEFGYERKYGPLQWVEGNMRQRDMFARWDFRRWMSYNYYRNGNPDSVYFNAWSVPGERGGLNSPQAVGLVTLHYDYEHLATRPQTTIIVSRNDSLVIWDENGKVKQPYLNRYENGNIDGSSKQQAWLDPAQGRKTGPFSNSTDSTTIGLMFPSPLGAPYYWIGRARPSFTLGWSQPVVHGYGFAPYTLPPGEVMHFSFAEVVGYGPGRATDSVYVDLGGASTTSDPQPGLHPVPSWYSVLNYTNAGAGGMGSNYLQTHPLPWYILNTDVVSIRDVADRAIQTYTGQSLVKWDTVQFDPRFTPAIGAYNAIPVDVPSPAITVENTRAAVNKISWRPDVEAFSSARLHAGLKYYRAMRAPGALGPWKLIDSVGIRDPRYFHDTAYVVYDTASNLGEPAEYAVVSVDSLGASSGMTNMTSHQTEAPAAPSLGKVYVVPNPLIVSNGLYGTTDVNGEPTDRLQFFGLTLHCTIRIFSYSGQLINTIRHDRDSYNNPWYQITRNNQLLASGVYFFVVQDDGGAMAHGKFVIIH